MAIRVELELQDGQFTTRMLHAGESLQQFQRNVGQTALSVRKLSDSNRDFLSTLRDVTVIIGVAGAALANLRNITSGWAGEIVKINADMERLQKVMQGMSNAADPVADAAKQLQFLRAEARQAPFSIGALSDVFVKLKTTGLDPAGGSMRALIDATAAFGGTDEQIKRASLAMSQMAGKGVIQMEELRQQLGEHIPRATELLARATGVSFAELVDKIGTGSVTAAGNLQKLTLEFERTFGGAAREQMNTFNGLMTQSKSVIQDFALAVGNAGFMDALKNGLREFNSALDSSKARAFAADLGNVMGSVVNAFVNAGRFVVEFREEIVQVGQALAVFLGARIALGGLNTLSAGIVSVTQNLQLMRFQAQIANNAFSGWAGMVASVRNMSDASAALALTMGAVGRTLPLIMGAIGGLVSVVIPLGIAVYTVANYFDLFSDRARDAWQELEKFEATSMKTIRAAEPLLEAQRRRVQLLEQEVEQQRRIQSFMQAQGANNPAQSSFLQQKERELAEARAKLGQDQTFLEKKTAEARAAEARKAAEANIRVVEEEESKIRKSYDQRSIDQVKAYEKLRSETIQAGRSVEVISKNYQNERRKSELSFYEEQIEVLQRFANQQREILTSGNDEQRAAAEETIAQLNRKMLDYNRQLNSLRDLNVGVDMNERAANEARSLEKAEKLLKSMKADAAGSRAELAGASSEAAKLAFELENGRFGATDNPAIARIIEQLKEAQAEKEKLDELLEGRQKLDRDISNARVKVEEELFELQTKNLTESEKIQIRLRNGLYKGFSIDGQGQVRSSIDGVRMQVERMKNSIGEAANGLNNNLFGPNTLSRMNTFYDSLERITGLWDKWKTSINGTDPSRAMNAAQSLPSGGFGSVGGSLVDRIIGVESGGNANARNPNSSATGLGQFIKGTWTQFLQEMHPELLSSWNAGNDNRTDPGLSREAVAWYANKNAQFLQQNGKQPTDAALYLSHFLGPQGALSTLNANMMQMTSSFLKPDQIQANRSILEGKTAAEVIAWAEKKVGGGTSYQQSNPRAITQPINPGASTGSFSSVTKELADLKAAEERLAKAQAADALKTELQEVGDQAKEAAAQIDGMGKVEAQVRSRIRQGQIDPANKDENSAYYQELIDLAKKADEAEKKRQETKRDRDRADSARERRQTRRDDLDEQSAAARSRLNDPRGINASDGYLALERQLRRENDLIARYYGERSVEYAQAEQEKAALLQQYRNAEIMQEAAGWDEKARLARQSTMTEAQVREAELQAELQRIQTLLSAFRGSAEERAALEQRAQALIGASRQKASASGPLGKQMQEWADVGGNMEKAMTGWLDGATDALASFITTGKADFKGLIDSILKDIARIALRGLFSGMFGGQGGKGNLGGASKFGGAAAGGGKGGAGKGILGFLRHSGGLVGPHGQSRIVNPAAFIGAPRFHTGGIISGLGIGPDEVPIIARKGEGVFTPEQMQAMGQMGGSQSQVITIAPSVTVNASGGTPDQNADLAQQTAKQVEGTIRQIVVKELLAQKRQGNMMSR